MSAFLLIAIGFFLSSVGLLHATDGRRVSGVLLSASGLLLLALANGVPLPIPGDDERNPVGWILLALSSVVLLATILRPAARRAGPHATTSGAAGLPARPSPDAE